MRRDKDHKPSYGPVKQRDIRNVAVAIRGEEKDKQNQPEIIASGKGKVARDIIEIAYENGIHVRKDCALAEILAQLDLDTPIPPEAIIAVAEILAKVYEANNAMANRDILNETTTQDTLFSGLKDLT